MITAFARRVEKAPGGKNFGEIGKALRRAVVAQRIRGWNKWSERDSNSRPLHCERSALPTELPPQAVDCDSMRFGPLCKPANRRSGPTTKKLENGDVQKVLTHREAAFKF